MKKRVLSKTTFLSLFMLILVSTGLSAQNYDLFNYNTTITPTVESFQMTRHGGLQHTLNTGTMSYSIPLYVYKDEDFEIPLSLDYSFDGYRPFVHSGTIGLGWFLNCGGVITRDVHGIPDDTNWGDNWEKGYFYTVQHCVIQTSKSTMMLHSTGIGTSRSIRDMTLIRTSSISVLWGTMEIL